MIRITIIASILLSLLAGCRFSSCPISDIDNIHAVELHKNSNVSLLVLSDNRKGTLWFKAEKGWRIESLKNVPQTCFQSVYHLSVSPDDTMLAVISAGEGHPYLEIFELNRILETRDSENDLPIKPILFIDPYPGSIGVNGWEDSEVILSSGMALERLDKKNRRPPPADPLLKSRTFYWNIETDTIKEK